MMMIGDDSRLRRRCSDIRMGRRPKRVSILFYNMFNIHACPLALMAAVSRDTLDESAFSHPLPTVFWRDKRFFNYLYTSFNDQPAAAPAATSRFSYIHIIIIYVYIISFYFSRPPPRLPITITGRLLAVIIKIKIMKTV